MNDDELLTKMKEQYLKLKADPGYRLTPEFIAYVRVMGTKVLSEKHDNTPIWQTYCAWLREQKDPRVAP